MKHFLVDIRYRVPAEEMAEITREHRAFLQEGYRRGLLLYSGPKLPKTGGLVLARAESLAELEEFFNDDPYRLHDVAEHTFTEFDPVFYQPFLAGWVSGES
jgi:uncharacterized protein YciI